MNSDALRCDLTETFSGRLRCHLVGDNDEELHYFAVRLGLKREDFRNPHYNLTKGKRALALKLGAVK